MRILNIKSGAGWVGGGGEKGSTLSQDKISLSGLVSIEGFFLSKNKVGILILEGLQNLVQSPFKKIFNPFLLFLCSCSLLFLYLFYILLSHHLLQSMEFGRVYIVPITIPYLGLLIYHKFFYLIHNK
jgi:hypothetical protein